MSNFEPVLNLPVDNLKERRHILEEELSKVIRKQVSVNLKAKLKEGLKDSSIKISKISWDFYPESDDEGGTDWWIEYTSAYDENDDYVDLEEYFLEKLSWDGKRTYEIGLNEEIREIISDFRTDLFNQNITEILL